MRLFALLMRLRRRRVRVLRVLVRMFVVARVVQRGCRRVMVRCFRVVLGCFQMHFLRHGFGPLLGSFTPDSEL